MEQAQQEVEERTRACLKSITESEELSPVIVVVGREGAGKASLIEHITGTNRLSRNSPTSVLKKPQITSTPILGQETFLISTPGFSDPSNAYVTFLLIANMINNLRAHITLQGVWYVINNSLPPDTRFDVELLNWLSAFCGKEYYPYITIVTTHWGCTLQKEFSYLTMNFKDWKHVWEGILSTDIETYQHGKRYNRFGGEMDQVPTLSWHTDKTALRENAREMVRRRCGVVHDVQPRFVSELNEGKEIGDTTAAKALRPLTPTPSSTSTSHPPPPPPPPPAAAKSNPPQPTPDSSFWGWLGNNIGIELNHHGISLRFGPMTTNFGFPSPSSSSSSKTNVFPSAGGFRPDPNSVVDAFKARGMDSSLAARTQWASQYSVDSGFPAGSAEQNRAILRAFRSVYS